MRSPSTVAVAALGLDTTARLPDEVLPDGSFIDVLGELRTDRLTGLAASAVASGAFLVTDPQREMVAEADQSFQRQTILAERAVLDLVHELRTRSIPFRVLKGPAFAHRHWQTPEHRPFVDFDLLVRGEDIHETLLICERLGAARTHTELRRGFDRRFGKGITLVGPSGIEWDIHRTLSLGPFGFLVDLADLWGIHEEVEIAGEQLATPIPEVEFVHACLHVTTTGTARLLSLRDVIQIGEVVDRDAVEQIARRWQATAVVRTAVTEAHDRLHLRPTPLMGWAGGLQPTHAEIDLLAVYAATGFSASKLAMAAVRHVPGWRGKAAYTSALVIPDRRNRRARQRSIVDHLRSVARNLR